MVLNYIWIAFFLIAFVVAMFKLLAFGDTAVFPAIVESTFEMAKTGFELSLFLTGVLALWMGLMRLGEKGGVVEGIYKIIGPFFKRIFPAVPPNHPVFGPMVMNFSANMLGLDNAATPLGLKTMEELQTLNPKPDTATNAQIMFLVLNTSGLTIIPVSIMAYRAQQGAANPADIFIPTLLATYFSTIAGLIAVSFFQQINLFNRVVLFYLGTLTLFIAGLIAYFSTLSSDEISVASSQVSSIIIFSIIITFILMAWRKKVNAYEAFIEGAKEGFTVAVKIIPYLVAILVAIGIFRTSGALPLLINGIAGLVELAGLDTRFVPALPTALIKPFSGGGARGMMVEAMQNYGADSFPGTLVSIMQGSTETTFYVIALYFGSVNITKTRYAVACGLIADIVGIIAAILLCYFFFGDRPLSTIP
ncbi:nucleoside recognition domain-containing protein [Flammeovirgaceae bacterium 311]|nr:nucleoside recognition domain-containing protein [Flammeovirgaceae bacterium 311]